MEGKLTTAAHEAAYQDILALMDRHAPNLPAEELLAIAANIVGKLIAFQDQRSMTKERAMQIVQFNIIIGNKQATDKMQHPAGNA